MATVKAFIRTSAKKKENVNIRFRLSDSRNIQLFHKSELTVDENLWNPKTQTIKPGVLYNGKIAFNKSITDRKNIVLEVYEAYEAEPDNQKMTSEILETKIHQILNPKETEPIEEIKQTFFEAFTEFLEKHKLSAGRKRHFNVVKRALQRFELYTAKMTKKTFKLNFESITKETLRDIETFLLNEFTIFETMPEIYKAVPESRTPQQRGQNTISNIFTKLRTFYHWSIDAGKTDNNPFKGFTVDECIYGTPYYISIEERNNLFKKDLSDFPKLAIQRDIFVFQCLIGARVGDFYNMTKSSVINGAIEYIPRKTKDGRPITVRVPLNATAKEILSRYPDNKNKMLLPFISEQKYNVAIKDAFKKAELTRMVTVINPTTREEEKKALNEIASSHLARRCFIGNLYKQVKDPNLVGALSGHKEGSKAFARYREIDEKMKIDLVNLLE